MIPRAARDDRPRRVLIIHPHRQHGSTQPETAAGLASRGLVHPGPALQDRHDAGLEAARDVDLARTVDEDVDLAPDAEVVEVDARLDREASPGQDEPLVVRL